MARFGTAFIDIKPDWSSFDREFARHGALAARDAGKLGNRLGSQLSKGASLALKSGAVAVGAGLAYSVKKAADFEQQLSSLGAVTDASAKSMDRLRKQALQAGADTKFSALEAAKAQTELAKGGLSVAQISKGGLRSALALAAAGELDLADAASTTVNAMKLFGLRGKDSIRVADGLATAANATTADVSDFALALTQGGSAAKAAGLDFTETTAALESLASIGIKGSDAGTSLKAALTQLAAPTKKSRDLMDQLNLSFFDAQGNMKPLVDVSKMLQDRLGGLTKEQRLQATSTLVGTDGMRALLALYDAGPKKIEGFERGLTKQGTAAEVARRKQDNLKGSLEQLGGSAETLGIQIGSAMTPKIREATDEATNLANRIGKIVSRKDLDLGEKLRKSFDLTKTTINTSPVVHQLERAISDLDIPDKLGRGVEAAIPVIADHAAKAAPKAAGAFVQGFLASGVWGRLAIGGFLLAKMGGPPAFLKVGTQAGANVGAGMATGVAASGLKARLGSTLKSWGPSLGLILGAALAPEVSRSVGDSLKTKTPSFNLPRDPSGGIFGLNFETSFTLINKKLHEGEQGLRDFGDTAEREFRRAAKARDAVRLETLADQARKFAGQFPQYGAELNRFASTADKAARDAGGSFRDLSRLGGRSMQKIKTATEDTAFAIKNTLGRDTRAGKRALAENFAGAAAAIQKSMDAGKISVKTGTAQIERYMLAALENVGFTKAQAIKVRRGQDPITGQNTRAPGGGHQRGGPIVVGAPAGDTVPAMLERGEYVLNREAVKHVGRHTLDRINFGAAPRFQTGGIVELLDPFNDPKGHGGSNAHLHVAMRSVQQVVALGKRLQKLGWLVGENPAFGGVHPVHAPGSYHYKGLAIDVNWPDPGKELGKIRALLPMLSSAAAGLGVAPKLRRMLAVGPDSSLKGVVQGALDLVSTAAQDRLDQAAGMTVEGAEPDLGGDASGNGADLMRRISKGRGWNFADWWALDASETSHGRNLSNPTSTARLRGQFLSSNYGKYGPGSDPAQHPSMAQQIQSMASYIADRYGNPTKAWAFHQAHNWYQKGGLAGRLSGALGKVKAGRTTRVRNSAVSGLLSHVKGLGLPKGLQSKLTDLAARSNTFGEFADRAGQLTVENTDGTSIPGLVNGRGQLDWLTEQLGALFEWRNAIIDAEKIIDERREQVRQLIVQARHRLATVQAEIEGAATVRKSLKGRLARIGRQLTSARKHPRQNAARIARLASQRAVVTGEIHGIDGEQRTRRRVQTALKGKILPGLTGKRSSLNTARGDLLSNLEDVQGIGSPMERLAALPGLGVLGGQIFGVQMRIRELTTQKPDVTDTSEAETASASILADLLRESNLRTAVSQAQYDVFRDFPPYGGSFATGGTVPGPPGAARTIIAHGGEEVVAEGAGASNVRVVVEDHRTRVFVDDVEQIVHAVNRRSARQGSRGLPGRPGVLT